MNILKILVFFAGFILFSLLTITPLVWLGILIFLLGLYQMAQRSKSKAIVSVSKLGRIMTVGFVIGLIMSLIYVEPSTEVEHLIKIIAVQEEGTNEDVVVDKTQITVNEIAPGSQLEEDPTEEQVASKPTTDVYASTPLPGARYTNNSE